jgi:hypothetical protein
MDSAMFQLMRSAEQAACDLKRLLDMEARSSEENRQGHRMNMELLEKVRSVKSVTFVPNAQAACASEVFAEQFGELSGTWKGCLDG